MPPSHQGSPWLLFKPVGGASHPQHVTFLPPRFPDTGRPPSPHGGPAPGGAGQQGQMPQLESVLGCCPRKPVGVSACTSGSLPGLCRGRPSSPRASALAPVNVDRLKHNKTASQALGSNLLCAHMPIPHACDNSHLPGRGSRPGNTRAHPPVHSEIKQGIWWQKINDGVSEAGQELGLRSTLLGALLMLLVTKGKMMTMTFFLQYK